MYNYNLGFFCAGQLLAELYPDGAVYLTSKVAFENLFPYLVARDYTLMVLQLVMVFSVGYYASSELSDMTNNYDPEFEQFAPRLHYPVIISTARIESALVHSPQLQKVRRRPVYSPHTHATRSAQPHVVLHRTCIHPPPGRHSQEAAAGVGPVAEPGPVGWSRGRVASTFRSACAPRHESP